ncbi:hypothetical protein ACFODO_07775 [Acinetobacter sichuanensis]|uniref:Uncharacterized protein n=1 Tax=Acinetobacter sichuanensis TaxID=2136183 RepID=A0A371YK28_9GAMM|nr:hypothetical protein [Acinetobacter sichuanensis]RFC81800.1 hypothetical protein C9E89_019840 [Acinetobacter sichuanensis]
MIGCSVFAVSKLKPEFVFEQFEILLKELWKVFTVQNTNFNPTAIGKLYFKDQEMYELWLDHVFTLNKDGEAAFLITYQFFERINMQTRLLESLYPGTDYPSGNYANPNYYIFQKNIYEYALVLPEAIAYCEFSEKLSNLFLSIFKCETGLKR